jgi:hypothetical protein
MNVGFIHGVMNTDNMSIAGETIDFGPCAFMETYHPGTVFSSIDQHGRYAYARQPAIAQWNLARFAEAILPLLAVDEDKAVEKASEILAGFGASYRRHWLQGMRAKLGLQAQAADSDTIDAALAEDWLALLQAAGRISRWPGAGWPMPPQAGPSRCANCFPTRLHWRHGSHAGGGAPRPKRGPPRNARRRCGASIPAHPAQPSRRGSPGRSLQRGRPGPVRRLAEGHTAPLRRRPRAHPLRRTRARGLHR